MLPAVPSHLFPSTMPRNFVKVEQRVTVRIKLDENADVARLKGGYNVECIVEE